ncbi:MAG TPA: 3-phosphoshikimate 1-carboxyvinyltransferase [Chitinispirillaceae bacterium]|nr:3-phosphoshikimate 1-carboxyvinyltransferase [Chitinispirillaceae bacterium]
MKWNVLPSRLRGTIAIPPSKSHSIRALLIAALADGTSVIRKPLLTGDGKSALNAAISLGAQVFYDGDNCSVKGIGNDFSRIQPAFDMGNSGTGTNLFTAAVALSGKKCTFDGDNSLRSRPFRQVLEALGPLGLNYSFHREGGDLPYTICGPIHGGSTTVNGVSSQFLSALLLCSPLIKDNSTIISVVNLHEHPYVELTLWWLKKQNIRIDYESNLSKFTVPGFQQYKAFDLQIPSDFSSATFAAVGAAIAGNKVTITGLDFSDPQGDKGVFDVIRNAGANQNITSEHVVSSSGSLSGNVIDLNTMPDALPALAVLACCSKGETRIVNVAQARIKETDRIAVMYQELKKMGADIQELPDGLVIKQSKLKGTEVCGHDDHRVVMALALAGMIAEGETVITTAEAADVTYPSFVKDFNAIGANITII